MAQSLQQSDSGRSRGGAQGACPPLFLDQTEARRAKNILGGDPPHLKVQGLDLALSKHHKLMSPLKLTRSINLV